MRERIINIANELFFTYGVRGVTIDDLARKAGIPMKTLYTFYPKKPDLVFIVVTSLLSWHGQLLQKCRDEAIDEVDEVLRASQTPFQTIAIINPLFVYQVEKFHQDAWQLLREHRQNVLLTTVAENLRARIKNGYFRTNLDVDFTSRVRVEQIIAALNMQPDAKISQKEMMRQYSELYLHAVVTEGGKRLLMKYLKAKNELN